MNYKEKYYRWLANTNVDQSTKKELESLPEKEIEERFYCDLEFGTGGLRGVMEAGSNRINVYTIRLATQGLANEIADLGDDAKKKGVVIAFDSRNNSKLFAAETAKVLCANGIKTYLFDDLRPTPELSFAVRHLGCVRGVVITASHNPKEYNGYKVYGEDGAQIEPETAKKIMSYINSTDIFDDIKTLDTNNAVIIGKEVDRAYLDAIKAQSTGISIPDDYKVVYTPLHGSGNVPVRTILSEIGVKNVFIVPEQELPDGDFPTVQSPNPENAEAFTIAVEYAKKQDADIVFGTDPDSDRIGVVVKNSDGEYVTLNGNQTGVLLCDFIMRKSAILQEPVVVKTIVTTEMVKAIAENYNARLIDVLTGFKFIGEQIKLLEDQGCPENYMFGLEESYGYLKGTYARDKDAVVASMLIAELAADCKANGMTLYDKLLELYSKYGFYLESLETKTLKGIDGQRQINEIMNKFRTQQLPFEVLELKDYSKGIDGLPCSDVLKFFLKGNAWFAVRPSGTEPKIKFYFGVCGTTEEMAKKEMAELRKTVLCFAG
ncbi:MAG: phospho-sugar mutase [Clostridia bacterium]|nr:phospho-sugar mutase [Clostridia bacterium]